MKKIFTTYLIAFFLLIFSANMLHAQHFTTIWTGNPYDPMAFIIQGATIDGTDMEAGDEIAVFDNDGNGNEICVGSVVLTGPLTAGNSATFSAAHEELGGDGFISGHTIIYKFWDSSESAEITMITPTYTTISGFDEVYTAQGTAVLTSLAGSSSVETTASSVTTCQGSVTVPVIVNNVTDVVDFTLILNYGTTNLTYTGYQNTNSQLSSGSLSISENGGEITVTWNSSTAANIASDTLLEFLFTASPVYSQTIENLTWDEPNSYYKNSDGDTLVESYINGTVTIDPIPVGAGTITGNTPVCQGSLAEGYNVGTITNATSYNWEISPSAAGTVNGSGTNITVDYSATYSGTATLSVYGSNSCGNGSSSSLAITVYAHPTVSAGSDASICEDAAYTLSGTAANQQSVLWTTSGDGTFDDATLLAATYTPGSNDISTGTTTLTLTAYAMLPCSPDVTDDMVITIQPLPLAEAGADDTICENRTYTLSGSATNQQSVLWTTAGDGTFDDATLLTATYTPGSGDLAAGSVALTITAYPITPCGTNATDDITITIQDLPIADAGADTTICENVTYTLSGTAANQQSVLWTTSGDGTFDDATILTATYTPGVNDILTSSATLTLTAYAITPCGTDAVDNMILSIQHQATANAGSNDTICENSTYTLSGTATNQQSILWTTSGDGSFDDATLPGATYTPGTSDISLGTVTLTITAYAITPCGTNASDDMTLAIILLPVTNAGVDETICETNPVYTLSGTVSNQTSILWTGGDGTFDDPTLLSATYTAGANDLATGSVILTITAYPDAPCATNAVDDMLLTYAPLPVAYAGPDDEICLNSPSYQLSGATATDYTDLLWTTSGDGTFDDTTILNPVYTPGTNDRINGTVDLTLTASSVTLCVDADTMTLTFAVLPTADAGADAEICEDNTYQLAGNATDYSLIVWTTDGDGTFDDPTSLTAIYTPGVADIATGLANLSLTAYASFPCVDDAVDTMTLNIAWLPIAYAGPDDEICLNSSTYYLANATAANQSSVLWTTSGDGTFDDSTLVNPTYTPGPNDIANFSVVLTMTAFADTPCNVDSVDNMVLTFALLPTADAGADDSICEIDTYTLSGSYTNGSSVLWTTSGDGTFDDATLPTATYTPGTSDISLGTVDLSITAFAQFPCMDDAIDTMTLSIVLQPYVDAGDDDTICASTASYQTAALSSGGISTLHWETTGDGVFDDTTIVNAIYYPGIADVANGGVNLILSANPIIPCATSVSDTMYLKIQPLATSNAGDDAVICENDTYTLSGSATNYDHTYWATLGDGTFDDPFLLNATYTPGEEDIANGSVNLLLYAYSIGPCSEEAYDEMTLTINSIPTANAGNDVKICMGESYTLSGSASNYQSTEWTTSGDGTFDDATLLNATYTPGTNDISEGNVYLTLTAFALAPCSDDATDTMELEIVFAPDQPQTPVGPTTVDLDATVTTVYTTNQVGDATSYLWHLEPIEAGTIEGNDTIGTVFWDAGFTGLIAYINVIAINDCGESSSDTLEVGVSPVGIKNLSDNKPIVIIAPNPSKGRFSIVVKGVKDDVNMFIVNSMGQVVRHQKLINKYGNETLSTFIYLQPSGTYYLKFVTKESVILKKVLIN